MTIVAGRLIVAGGLLTGIAMATGRGLPARSMWGVLLVMAVLNNAVPFVLITWAQKHIASGLAGTLTATMPLFTFVIAATIGLERATIIRAAGLIVGFAGATIVIAPDMGDLTSSSMLGELAVIGGALAYGASAVFARRYLSGDSVVLASGQMLLGMMIMTPLALAIDGAPDTGISAKAALSWAGLGVFSSGFAYIIYFTLIQRVTATQVSLVSYLFPVVATALGYLVLDEPVDVNLFVGLPLILLGMMVVNDAFKAIVSRERTPDAVEASAPGG
jgi:drug/metabolite transporter (DMT)-like permease